MRDRGCNVHKTEFGVCGHRAWTPAMLQGDIFGWLISRAKDGDRYLFRPVFADVSRKDRHFRRRDRRRPQATADQGRETAARPSGGTSARRSSSRDVLTAPVRQSVCRRHASTESALRGRVPSALCRQAVAPSVDRLPHGTDCSLYGGGRDQESAGGGRQSQEPSRACRISAANARPDSINAEVLDYVDRELDRIEQRGETSGATGDYRFDGCRRRLGSLPLPCKADLVAPRRNRLRRFPPARSRPRTNAAKNGPCRPTTLYGLFPNGWDQEAAHVPGYIVNETGRQLRDRLAKAFAEDDLAAMKEFCAIVHPARRHSAFQSLVRHLGRPASRPDQVHAERKSETGRRASSRHRRSQGGIEAGVCRACPKSP